MADMSTDTVLLRLSFKRREDLSTLGIKLPNLVVIHGESRYPGFRQALPVMEGTAMVETVNDHDGFNFVIETENDLFAISDDHRKIPNLVEQRLNATLGGYSVLSIESKKYNPYAGSDGPEKTAHILQLHHNKEIF